MRERVERFSIEAAKERWLEFLSLEPAILAPPRDFWREGGDLLVARADRARRRIRDGRIPRAHAAALFLQAAAAASLLQARGLWLDEEDLLDAGWDAGEGTARLWLTRSPASIARGGPGPAPAAVLAALLARLAGRGRGGANVEAGRLFERLLAPDAAHRRADFWVASAFRSFPELHSRGAAAARSRTIGLAGFSLTPASSRALGEKSKALLAGREPRLFSPAGAAGPGGALELGCPVSTVAAAARALRERHARESSGRPATWIAVEPELWDTLSRRGFETASLALRGEVEVVEVDGSVPPPLLPDEWRREIFVPCGTLNASLRFYDRFAALVKERPSGARTLAEAIVRSEGWGAFVSDPTGDAPIPDPEEPPRPRLSEGSLEDEVLAALAASSRPAGTEMIRRLFPRRAVARALRRLETEGRVIREPGERWRCAEGESPLAAARREELCRRWAGLEEDPARRVELWIAGGEIHRAAEEAERWYGEDPGGDLEKWFGLSALLGRSLGGDLPGWLEFLEAEREIAGGRLGEAQRRLERIAGSSGIPIREVRSARLRLLEVSASQGRVLASAREAAAWRRDHANAPAAETLRALLLEAAGRSREGDQEGALTLLDEAERIGSGLPLARRLEAGLARADVLSRAGRFREERQTYERWRPEVLASGDDALAARLLAREALGLSDRGDFAAAVARLEEALTAARDDPVERARMCLNLAATLYHAGRPARCRPLLDEAIALAAAAGREDLARTARANRLELSINAGDWDSASREIETLLSLAAAQGDETRRLVALHHRSRLALRRGLLEQAAADNALARELAGKLSDRLETGELWLEEGDRRLYEGKVAEARAAYAAAAEDPPDRCDSAERAAARLREIAWSEGEGPEASAAVELTRLFDRDEYAAAEQAARWEVLFENALPELLRSRAVAVLRRRGGEALANRVFGANDPAGPGLLAAAASLRGLRDDAAGSLAGEERSASSLAPFGLAGLSVSDREAREILRLGEVSGDSSRRLLDSGASSYELTLSPPPPDPLADAIALMLETLLFRLAPPSPPSDFAEGWRRLGVVAADPSMEEPYRRLVRFAPAPVTVLVRGESGSGKEAVARAVHALSPRAPGPFVAVNVPAVPATLLESELFGHARGAFTGADRDRRGLLEEAERGTIFFDEIGDLTPPLQAKLLRALQEREIRRVGENRPRRLDVRVVSATSKDLEREVDSGRFREDLYYRLHVAVIALPPLRERGRDAVRLARYFLERCSREFSRGQLAFAPEALSAISSHSWPGNVRELQNVVSQAAALALPGAVVGPELLPEPLRRPRRSAAPAENYHARMDEHRRTLIAEALERTGGNRSRAARDLGLSRQALLYLIRELKVPVRAAREKSIVDSR